ncbi:MAG: SPOR domain-containing protein, partial [Xanthomonadales bacterium]|nr:SPOR domain-containing protein [Xanthomonadales bacterium]
IQDQELVAGNRHCFSLGPFHTVEERTRLRSQLRGIVTAISERQTRAMVEEGYWIFLPPYASLLDANRALLSLRALGLEDIAVIHDEGEWKNAISLGYFMRQGNANRRRQQLKERGFDPQVLVRRHAEPRYWLDYEQAPGVSLLEVDLQDFPNDFTKRALPCPELGFFRTTETGRGISGQDAVSEPEPDAGSGDDNG